MSVNSEGSGPQHASELGYCYTYADRHEHDAHGLDAELQPLHDHDNRAFD